MDNTVEISKENLNLESLCFDDKAVLSAFEESDAPMLNMPCGGECFCN